MASAAIAVAVFSMAGYSGTPLPQKLGLKPGARFGLLHPPADFARTLGALPPGVVPRLVSRSKGELDVIVCFARTLEEVARDLPALRKVCAIDEVWSGLRFVVRLADRPPRTRVRAARR